MQQNFNVILSNEKWGKPMCLKKTKAFYIMISMLVLIIILVGCSKPQGVNPSEIAPEETEVEERFKENPSAEITNKTLLLSTTTSPVDSGLLDYLHPIFTEETGIKVKAVAVGTGQALQMGIDGEADVLLVHAKASEEKFVAEGHGIARFDVMYNDFVLIGPADDPAGISTKAPQDVLKAFQEIYDQKVTFISRGDDSGTHKKELSLWNELGLKTSSDWYIEAGQGMGAVIQMANEMGAYTLTDRGTYLSMKNDLDLVIVNEGDTKLLNQYGLITVNPDKNDQINYEAAEIYIQWMLSHRGQQLIGEFGKDKFGEALFIPNAK